MSVPSMGQPSSLDCSAPPSRFTYQYSRQKKSTQNTELSMVYCLLEYQSMRALLDFHSLGITNEMTTLIPHSQCQYVQAPPSIGYLNYWMEIWCLRRVQRSRNVHTSFISIRKRVLISLWKIILPIKLLLKIALAILQWLFYIFGGAHSLSLNSILQSHLPKLVPKIDSRVTKRVIFQLKVSIQLLQYWHRVAENH